MTELQVMAEVGRLHLANVALRAGLEQAHERIAALESALERHRPLEPAGLADHPAPDRSTDPRATRR